MRGQRVFGPRPAWPRWRARSLSVISKPQPRGVTSSFVHASDLLLNPSASETPLKARGAFARGRLLVLLGLAAGIALLIALATGAFSSKSGSEIGAPGSSSPTVGTPANSPPESSSSAAANRRVPTPFGVRDWGTYGGSYDQIRHSPLTQITKDNVDTLGRVYSVDFRQLDRRVPKGQQSFPIVINGVIYVTTSSDFVFAIDARSGKELWEFVPSGTAIFKNFGVTANRGLAYCDGKLFLLTLDMRLISINPRDGHRIGSVLISDAVSGAKPEFGYSETQAPICYKNLVLVGAAGSDYGVRGFEEAYHTDLRPAWPTPYWTVPPWGQSWRSLSALAGGGTAWNPATIDPSTDIAYFSVAAPSPQYVPQLRPGPDPRSNSIVAVDVFTGRQLWWQQQLGADSWSYGTSQPPLLYEGNVLGRRRRIVSLATKEGVWFAYDARTGQPIYQRVNLLNQNEHAALQAGKAVVVYPGSIGGLNYSPSSYDPATDYVVNSQAETASVLVQKNVKDVLKHNVLGDVELGLANSQFGQQLKGWHDFGSISAIDLNTGQIAWKMVVPEPGRGGVTPPATGLSFVGGGDGVLQAVDTRTGTSLWKFQTGFQIASGASIFELGGKEYVAITTGGTPTSSNGGTASRLDVFALGGSQTQSPPPLLTPAGLSGTGALPLATKYLGLGRDSRTLTFNAVIGATGKPTIDESSHGALVLTVPRDWTVNVTAANHDPAVSDGLAVLPLSGSRPIGGTPAFAGGTSSRGKAGLVAAGGVAYFSFRADREGVFALSSLAPGRAAAGEWVTLKVGPAGAVPSITSGGQTFAIDTTAGRP